MGKLRVYCLKTLKKLSAYPLGNTPSAPSVGYLYFHTTTASSTMPMSARSIPGTQDQYGRGHAAVRVWGQTGHRTNAGRAITPFMFNEEGYRVSPLRVRCYTCVDLVVVRS